MSVRFYFDHNMQTGIVNSLRNGGVDVLTALEDDFARASDAEILQRALELERATVTHDHDFIGIAKEWNASNRPFYGIVYCRLGRTTIQQIATDLELIASALSPEEIANSIVWIPF